MFVVIKVKKNSCVDCWKLWHIMRVNKIMSWKIMDVKIWFDCTSYSSWLCEEKQKKLKKWLCKMEMRMKRHRRGKKNEKEKWEMKWPQRGQIKKEVRFLGWKTQKFTSGRLQMRSVFGYGSVSFGENPRTTVHCVIACKHLHHGCIWKKDLYYLSSIYLDILFKYIFGYIIQD